MTYSVLGHAVVRREDPDLLTGAARYVADLELPGLCEAVFVRSVSPHARLVSVQRDAALAAPGVVAVLTASDLDVAGIPETPTPGHPARSSLARPVLATERVRFVGEPVAMVVATNRAAAVDAAELVEVELDDLAPLPDPLAAAEPGAELLFPELGTNVVIDLLPNDTDVLADADVVVTGTTQSQRVAPVPLEPNGALAAPGHEGSTLVVWASTQTPFGVRNTLADLLRLDPAEVRVIAPAVGGGFGAKGGCYPELVATALAALRLGRPVRWVEERSENLVAMTHGRAQRHSWRLGARRDGTVVGLELDVLCDVGAYPWRGAIGALTSRLMASGPYRIPRVAIRTRGVVTNATPVGPYRGAGRPEAALALEQAMDALAAELGIDPVEVRRVNLLRPEELPWTTPTGAALDSGNYVAALEHALGLAGMDQLRAEQAARRARNDPVELGIGVATFCEVSGSGSEYASVSVDEDGSVVVASGSSPHGQGHETALAQVASSVLGVPMDSVRVVFSDTARVSRGVGTFGSRSGQLAGAAARQAAEAVSAQARRLAAHLLEADPADLVQLDDGRWAVAGVPTTALGWAELAKAAAAGQGPTGEPEQLAAEADFAQPEGTYPFGAHVAVVEVDTETGQVRLRRLVAVDDCGTVLNPLLVEGQVHGGLAQGIAQALFEAVRYDDAGNPLTANLADYLVPSAADLPPFETAQTVTPTPRNPLGAKGIGEAGTTGATAAVLSAFHDALAPYGVAPLQPPLAPEAVWRACRAAAVHA